MSPRKHHSAQTAKELFLEQAAAYFDDMNTAANNAPYGQVLHHIEAFALQEGRTLLRQSIEGLLQEQIHTHEKKKKRHSAKNVKRKNDIAATEEKESSAPSEP
jgi:hypothetical protein